MSGQPKLHAVPDDPEGEIIRDLQQRMRDEIAARDWSACHIRGDRAAPLALADCPRRMWRR